MKGQFLKKIAAVGTGLALVAGSVVAAVNWSDMVDETNKTMKVSGIVVGANADPMDSTAANALAAALASKYTYDKMTEVTEQVPIEGTAGLDATNAKEKKDAAVGSKKPYVMGDGQLKAFVNESKSMVVNDSSLSKTIKETLGFSTTPKYATAKNIQELVSEVSNGDFNYVATITNGLDLNTNTYNSNSKNYVTLPFMGEWYELDNANKDAKTIELVSEGNADNWLNEGETITGLASKSGSTTYMVKVANAFSDGNTNKVTLELYDETTGAKIASEDVIAGEPVRFRSQGKELLQESLKVKEIARRTVSSSDSFRVNIRTGLNRVVLKDGKCYPNWEDTASKTKCDWEAIVNFNSNTLNYYGLKTTQTYTGTAALRVNDSLVLPNNYGAVQFLGLSDEDVYSVEFGVVIPDRMGEESTNGFKFMDVDETTRVIPYYFELGSVTLAPTDEPQGFEILVDGQEYTLFLQRDANDLNSSLESGYDVDPDTVVTTVLAPNFFTDVNFSATDGNMNTTIAIPFDEGDVSVDYNVMLTNYSRSGDEYNLWLTLAPQQFTLADNKALDFLGTDVDEDGTADNSTFFLNHEEFILDDVEDENYYSAVFKLDTVSAFVDTTTGVLTDDGDTDNGLSYAMEYNGNKLRTKSGERKQYIDENYTLTIIDDEIGKVEYYDNVRNARYKFFDSTMITAEGATKEVTTTKPVKTPYAGMPTVMTDVAAGAGNYIVVGGYFVNDLFAKVAADAETAAEKFGEALAEAGDKVTKVIDGSLYVAGYTKKDTMDAVEALIDELNL